MIINYNKLILILTLFIASFSLQGQSVCIDFDDVAVGTQYGSPANQIPGETFISGGNIDLRIEPLLISFPNNSVYDVAEIVPATDYSFGGDEGNMLHLQNIRFFSYFSTVPEGVSAVTFDFYELTDGTANYTTYNFFGTSIIHGFTDSLLNYVPYESPDFNLGGSVYYSGDFNQFTFGGENVLVDNICFWYDDAYCDISNYEFSYGDCGTDTTFTANISFDAENVGNQGFTIYVNGEIYESFAYGNSSYAIENLLGNGVTTYEITIKDNLFDCVFDIFSIPPQACSSSCAIGDVTFEYIECTEATQGTYLLDFNYINPVSNQFSVSINGSQIADYNYVDLPVVVSIGESTEKPIITICDVSDGVNCCSDVDYNWEYCTSNSCSIVTSILDIFCEGEDFYLVIGTDGGGYYEGGYSAYINEEFIESIPPGFNYPDTIGPISGGAEDYTLTVVANNFPSCNFEVFVGTVDLGACTFDQMLCEIDIINMTTSECENEQFYFEFDIDTSYLSFNGGSDSFNLQVSWYDEGGLGGYIYGEDFGNIEYADGGYSIGPFSTNPDTSYLISARDLNLEFACGDTYPEYLLPPACIVDACEINDLTVTTSDCYDGGLVDITLNFSYSGEIASMEYSFVLGGVDYGSYSLLSPTLTVLGFPANGEMITVNICIEGEDDCCAEVTVEIPDCEELIGIYPGDCNDDNICNNFDILNIGLGYLGMGEMREMAETDWQLYDVQAWVNSFANGTNYAHADADGDGEILATDADIVTQNYGLTHGDVDLFIEQETTPNSPDLFADLPDNFEITQGEAFNVPIVLGSTTNQVESIYGLSFTLMYDPEIIDPNSVEMEYATSWFGVPQTNLITFDRHDMVTGEIDITLVRTDQNNTSGFGEIMHFIGVVDNIAGKTEITVTVKDVFAITQTETRLAFKKPVEIATITSTDNIALKNGFEIYPNPTTDFLFVKNQMGLAVEEVQITDINGRLLQTAKDTNRISTTNLPSGIYWVRCVAGNTVGHLRMVKL